VTHRYYLKNSVPTFQPTLKGAWDTTANVVYRELGCQDGPVATVAQTKTNANTAWDMALICIVCKFPFSGNLQVSNPTVSGVYARLSSVASAFNGHSHAWISTGATSTVRTTIAVDAIGGSTWETTATFRVGLSLNITPSSVAVTAGDYLVYEVGVRGITSSTTAVATAHYGGVGPDAVDLATLVKQPGWMDFYTNASEDLLPRLPVIGTPMMMAA
jgi:hypothetical protein